MSFSYKKKQYIFAKGLSCFQCDHVAKPSDCTTANRCSDQEVNKHLNHQAMQSLKKYILVSYGCIMSL